MLRLVCYYIWSYYDRKFFFFSLPIPWCFQAINALLICLRLLHFPTDLCPYRGLNSTSYLLYPLLDLRHPPLNLPHMSLLAVAILQMQRPKHSLKF
jgi:hypothetical protein